MLVKSRAAQLVAVWLISVVLAAAAALAWPSPFERCERPGAMRIHTGTVQTCTRNGFWK